MEDGMETGGGRFDGIDPNLTVFALANGLDLAKGEDHRRLEWFSEGLERAIVLAPDGDDAFRVRIMSWRSNRPDARVEVVVAEGLAVDQVRGTLSDAIERANDLDAPPGGS